MTRSLGNIKQKGFTIVELLIVIVVIGILAAITIVAYSGITARANATKAQTNAANTQKVAEAYNADANNSAYPTLAQLQAYSGLTKLPTGITLQATAPDGTNGTTNLLYVAKSTTGGCIGYWDFANNVVKPVYVGNATSLSGVTCS